MDGKERVEARSASLYGEVLGPASGVVHVVALARDGASLEVMRVGEHAPQSPTDLFVLQLSRARVDAIVVSGSVLRAEPELRYDLTGDGLREWRGARPPPWVMVLTQSGDLPREHPVWESWARPVVYTGDAAIDLPERVEIVRDATPSPRRAIRHLRQERGCASVSIEAGPTVAVPLYDDPCVVDEALISVFLGPLAPDARAGRFLDPVAITGRLRLVGGPTQVEEASGPWTFARYLRR